MDGSVYDVFLNFRGIDTRLGFTGNLHRALCAKQIKSFMDDQDLEKGAEINPALDNAIQTSRIALVILSKNYASSTFCLDELEKIMDCSQHKGMLVLPVFYKVEPSDVRYQKGEYADSLKKHEARIIDEKEKIKEWRFALRKVSHHSGWNLKDYRYEYELIDIIVEDIIKKIHRLRDAEKEKRICNVDEKHVTKPNTVENLVTDPTPQNPISRILNDDSMKMIATVVLIQQKFRRGRIHREHQAIKIQAAFRGYQVRKQYRHKMTSRFCVLKHGNETEEDLFLEGTKQAKKRVEMYEASAKVQQAGFSRSSLRLKHRNKTEEDLFLEGMKQAKKRVERYEASVKAQQAGSSRSSLRLKHENETEEDSLLEGVQKANKRIERYEASVKAREAGSSRSSLRPGQVPEEMSASLYRERQAIKIQAAFRGYQVRNRIITEIYFRNLEVMKDVKKLNKMYDASGSSRSSLRHVQVPEEMSASLCFKAGLHHLELVLDDLELDHVSDAWSCFGESFRLFAKKQKEKTRFYFRSRK